MLVDMLSTCRVVLASAASAVVSTYTSAILLHLELLQHSSSCDALRDGTEFKQYLCPGAILDTPDAATHATFYNSTVSCATEEDDGDSDSTNICSSDTSTSPNTITCCYYSGDWSMLFTIISAVLFMAILHNIIACYNFVAAWNLIREARRVEIAQLYICRQRRRMVQDVMATHVHVDKMKDFTSCPICLEDFYEQDLVTNCDEGCGNYFHKECLFNWLEYNNTCACCRKDLISAKSKGWMASFVSFWAGSSC